MSEVIKVNGISIQVYKQRNLVNMTILRDNNSIAVLCPIGTTDEEIIQHLKNKCPTVLFQQKRNPAVIAKPMTNNRKNHICGGGSRKGYDPMTDPRNPFSPLVPTIANNGRTTLDKRIISSIVKNSSGTIVQHPFICSLCSTSQLRGREYLIENGRFVTVCAYCRDEILMHKGWIHELPANIGHGK